MILLDSLDMRQYAAYATSCGQLQNFPASHIYIPQRLLSRQISNISYDLERKELAML